MKIILLTGATGFLGSHILESLIKNNYQPVIVKRSMSDTWRIDHLLTQVKIYNMDEVDLEQAFTEQKIDVVIHTATNYGRIDESISEIIECNLVFGLKLLDNCLKFNVNTFINTDTFSNTSTSKQKYLNIYNLSKKQFVEWLYQQSDKIQIINLKLEHMYGPKDNSGKFVSWLLSEFEAEVPEIKLTLGEQKRDFIYIDDVVSAYILMLKNILILPEFNEFDVGTGKLISIKSFVEKLKQVYENEINEAKSYLNFGGIPYREGEMMTVSVDNQKLINLGWSPKFTLENGLKRLLKENK
ncbi:MAG: NAD(P)-dependent oxidoreductase [gamma proteobacterium symbiont of Lucinoma myriamae]|nr:NAD(P)-dependent oxidoreductase [gamma proteobacterium symbiont of Lucinoma myriamae]MCU7819397.1 NAD(P)-dependent oxidoreductase [gamma proteobacterium symbiont of Lucinoma myriamae]